MFEKKLKLLVAQRKAFLPLAKRISEADGGRIFSMDFLANAVINRSMGLVDGFVLLVENEMFLCAAPLLRLQIDSMLRLFACFLVDDANELAHKLIMGNELNTLKTREGKNMTDGFLTRTMSREYPWVSSVYKQTSAYVHFSQKHFLAIVESSEKGGSGAFTTYISGKVASLPDEIVDEMVDAFAEATKCVMELCSSWLSAKEEGARQRGGLS